MHVCQSLEHLDCEVLDMVQGEFLLGVDDPVQVRLHELGDDVDIWVSLPGLGLEQIGDGHNVLVFEIF